MYRGDFVKDAEDPLPFLWCTKPLASRPCASAPTRPTRQRSMLSANDPSSCSPQRKIGTSSCAGASAACKVTSTVLPPTFLVLAVYIVQRCAHATCITVAVPEEELLPRIPSATKPRSIDSLTTCSLLARLQHLERLLEFCEWYVGPR